MEVMAQIWSLIGLIAVLQSLIPTQVSQLVAQWWARLQDSFNPYHHLDVPDFHGNNGVDCNDLYRNVELYLGSLDTIANARRVTMSRTRHSKRLGFSLASSQTVEDSFKGATFWWTHDVQPPVNENCNERRNFTLKMAKADRHLLAEYIDHIADYAEELNRRNRDRILYTNAGDGRYECAWGRGVAFKHPSTFKTLALDPATKAAILTDLDRFSRAREFYARVGRPWKRGYLLHGPPGTGKSSLIAAMANYMKYDIYDLELTKVHDNSELRALLLQTTEKSIIVVEDIDCALDLTERRNPKPTAPDADDGGQGSRMTLSGLLNFTDGLWSCCGEERIVVYTTNHKDMLDAALLRSGRMDMHILLSHCSFPAFKTLAFNYLRLTDHHLFPAVEQRIADRGAEMTPAEITEILIRHVEDPLEALNAVISALDAKICGTQSPTSSASEAIDETHSEEVAEGTDGAGRDEGEVCMDEAFLRRRKSSKAEHIAVLRCDQQKTKERGAWIGNAIRVCPEI